VGVASCACGGVGACARAITGASRTISKNPYLMRSPIASVYTLLGDVRKRGHVGTGLGVGVRVCVGTRVTVGVFVGV